MMQVPQAVLQAFEGDARRGQALRAGSRLAWYEIQEPIGLGGFGITYRARDVRLREAVAIKEYFPGDHATRGEDGRVGSTTKEGRWLLRRGLVRFRQEARLLSSCRHPNIVQVRALLAQNDTEYMVMDYEKGSTLYDLIETEPNGFDERILLRMTFQLMHALAVLHATGIIHRDITPQNILVRDCDRSPVLLDFGSARDVGKDSSRPLTRMHTDGYAPIEQYGSIGQNMASDIYSLGATLYHAITRSPPASAQVRQAIISVEKPDPLAPSAVVAEGRYSNKFLSAVDHALKIRATERPQSLEEWYGELPKFGNIVSWQQFTSSLGSSGVDLGDRAIQRDPGIQFSDPLPNGTYGPSVVVVPDGEYLMGSPETETGHRPDEEPIHRVVFENLFAIGECPITFEQFDQFANAVRKKTPSDRRQGRGKRPVFNISWHDAIEYTEWLSSMSGYEYRLPTEAEWEYAARAGATTPFWWGDNGDEVHGHFDAPANTISVRQAELVGSFDANPFGIFDTAGNVWEWVEDGWSPSYEDAPRDGLANVNTGFSKKVARGGSRVSKPQDVRSARRCSFDPETRSAAVGFRVVRVLR